MPEGSRISAGLNNLTISYRGGTGGNNVVLYRTGGLTTVVNSTADVTDPNDGVVTLREAINYARLNAATTGTDQTVTFALGSYPATITLQAGADYGVLAVNQNSTLSINGPAVGTGNSVTVSGGGVTSIFNLATATNLSNLTLSGGSANYGGAILNNSTTTLTSMTIQDNVALDGGGIWNVSNGNLTIINSTFANNTATLWGGAIGNYGGCISLSLTTIAFNQAGSGAGGIIGSVNMTNSIVANNNGSFGPDISGDVYANNSLIGNTSGVSITGSNNQQNVNALLGTLNYYGGTTKVFPLLPGSPAINSGAGSNATDQRGITVAGTADMGSFQSRGFNFSNTGGTGQTAMIGDAFPTNLSLSVASAYSEPVNGGVVTFTAPVGNVPSATLAGSTTISGGNVSLQATANAFYGSAANQTYNIAANASGVAAGTLYQLLNVGTPYTMSITGGNNQSGNITGTFGQTLGINVKDSVGNNLPRLSVTFTPTTISNIGNSTFGALGNIAGAGAGNVYTASTDANGQISGLSYATNGIGGLVRIETNATVASNSVRPAGTATANFTEGAVGVNVQNGTVGRSFVNAVSGLFGSAGLAANLPASQYKIQYLGYSGTDTPANVTLATGSAAATNINWNYGASGITGDPNSQTGDGVYQLAVDYNNDGVYETTVKFHRLFGDTNGDRVVDTLDYNVVVNPAVYSKSGITSGANTNGVGQVYTKDITTVLRQRGRRVGAYSAY